MLPTCCAVEPDRAIRFIETMDVDIYQENTANDVLRIRVMLPLGRGSALKRPRRAGTASWYSIESPNLSALYLYYVLHRKLHLHIGEKC